MVGVGADRRPDTDSTPINLVYAKANGAAEF
jgi:hypothetical protein